MYVISVVIIWNLENRKGGVNMFSKALEIINTIISVIILLPIVCMGGWIITIIGVSAFRYSITLGAILSILLVMILWLFNYNNLEKYARHLDLKRDIKRKQRERFND